MGERTVIGTYTLTEPTEFTQLYECAAWYTKILVPAGEYEVLGTLDAKGEVEDLGIGVKLKGQITAAHFPALFGGVAYTSGDRPDDIGKQATYHVSPYAHAVAKSLVEGRETRFSLNDNFEARKVPYEWDGEQRHTYGIFSRS